MACNFYGSECSSDEEIWLDFSKSVECEVEDEDYELNNSSVDDCDEFFEAGPYSEEPLADEEWLTNYNKERERSEERNKKLQDRLDETITTDSWCKCGNCNVERLQNPCESQCCLEIDACVESLASEEVAKEVETSPLCITHHPGFNVVCLNRWSLRSSAAKYRTIDGIKYRKLRTENELLRTTAYREYIQLIHGHLGGKRIPLPACVYDIIRKEFPSDNFCGYEDN